MNSLKHASITFNPSFTVDVSCLSDKGDDQIFHIHIEFNDDVIKVPIISVLDFKRSFLDCYDNKHIKMNYRYNVPYLNFDELYHDDIDRYSAETYGKECRKKADVFFTRDAFMIRCQLDNPTFKSPHEKVEEGETVWGPEIHGICANRNSDTLYKSAPTIDICIKKSYIYAALIQHGYEDYCIPKMLELATY